MDSKNISTTNFAGAVGRSHTPLYKSSQSPLNIVDSFQKQDSGKTDAVDVMKAAGKLFANPSKALPNTLWEFQMGAGEMISISRGSGGVLYAAGQEGKIVAIDEKDGGKIWEFDTKSKLMTAPVEGKNGNVYGADVDGNLFALDKKNGRKKWTFPSEGFLWKSPVVGSDNTVYFGSSDKKVVAVDGDTGEKKWDFNAGASVNCTPVIDDKGTVFASSSDGKLFALDSKTGEIKWAKDAKAASLSNPVLSPGNTLIVGTSERKISGIDKESGEVKWEYETKRWDSHPVMTPDGVLVESDLNNIMYGLDPETGKELWKMTTPTYDHLTPMVGEDGLLYIATTEKSDYNRLCAIRAKDGETVLEQNVAPKIGWKPAIAWDKQAIVGVDNGKIQAFALNAIDGVESDLLQELKKAEDQPEAKLAITMEQGQVNIGGVNLPIRNINH